MTAARTPVAGQLDRVRRCGACTRWMAEARTELGRTMVVDLDPIAGGNVELERDADGRLHVSRVVVPPDRNVVRYVAHQATCIGTGQSRRLMRQHPSADRSLIPPPQPTLFDADRVEP